MLLKISLKYLVCGLALLPLVAYSQVSPEIEYAKMKEAAFNGKYDQAKQIGNKLLGSMPDYHDVSIMLGRVYMWGQQYDSAKIFIDNVLQKSPQNGDAIEAKYDLAFFTNDYAQVVSMGDTLVSQNPGRTDFKEKLALAYLNLNQKEKAENLAREIIAIDMENKVALMILDQLHPQRPLEVMGGYSFDHFNKPFDRFWHLYTLGASKQLSWGNLAGRVNIGHLNTDLVNDTTEMQVELESNFKLSSQAYMMLLYGYSPGNYFPTHKASAEIWRKLPYKMVISVGGNYYYWDSPIFIGTASLEKYVSSYWFCFRTYFNFKDVGVTTSYYLTARKYFNDIDYLQCTLGYGAAPDEPFDIKTDLERQNASSIRVAYMKKIATRTKMRLGFGYAYEEYDVEKYRDRFDGTLTLIYSLGK